MARMIDADQLADGLKLHRQPTDQKHKADRQWAVGYNAGLDRALYSIAYAPTITQPNEWVSVEERLPGDSDGAVLLTNGKTVISGYRNQLFGLDGQHGIFVPAIKKGGGYMRVTHWMPLPQPPKEASHD